MFDPHLSMNDYVGLVHALAADASIDELTAIVQPERMANLKLGTGGAKGRSLDESPGAKRLWCRRICAN
jgi:hypothetical protein